MEAFKHEIDFKFFLHVSSNTGKLILLSVTWDFFLNSFWEKNMYQWFSFFMNSELNPNAELVILTQKMVILNKVVCQRSPLLFTLLCSLSPQIPA